MALHKVAMSAAPANCAVAPSVTGSSKPAAPGAAAVGPSGGGAASIVIKPCGVSPPSLVLPVAVVDPATPLVAKATKRQRTKAPGASEDPVDAPMAPVDEKPPESGTWLIVAKAVRSHLKASETSMHCGSDALPALNAKLADMIRDAVLRASLNGRKTIKACDF